MANFVSYSNAEQLMTKIGQKFESFTGAYIPKGSYAFASLPATPTLSMAGNVYNITDNFTTDARFVEGAGKEYGAGSNVVVVDNTHYDAVTPAGSEDPTSEGWYELDSTSGKYVLSEDTTVDNTKTYYEKIVLIQFDVLAAFVDLTDIENTIDAIEAMITGEFDADNAYAEGDIVIHEDALYKFVSAHTASDPWDATEVASTTIIALINAVLTTANANINAAKATVEAMVASAFDSANAYAAGDVVTYEDALYKFVAAHTAGDPWDATEVTATTVTALVTSAEPDELTPAQIADLEALLD